MAGLTHGPTKGMAMPVPLDAYQFQVEWARWSLPDDNPLKEMPIHELPFEDLTAFAASGSQLHRDYARQLARLVQFIRLRIHYIPTEGWHFEGTNYPSLFQNGWAYIHTLLDGLESHDELLYLLKILDEGETNGYNASVPSFTQFVWMLNNDLVHRATDTIFGPGSKVPAVAAAGRDEMVGRWLSDNAYYLGRLSELARLAAEGCRTDVAQRRFESYLDSKGYEWSTVRWLQLPHNLLGRKVIAAVAGEPARFNELFALLVRLETAL